MKRAANLVLATVLGLSAAGGVLATPALAQDAWDGAVSEARLGIFAYDAYKGFVPSHPDKFSFNRIQNLDFEVLFRSPQVDAFRWIGAPRPVVGASVNLDGGVSFAYAALNWHVPLFETPFYLEGTFGAAANNGYLTNAPAGAFDMGCRVQFYENAGIGANLSDTVTATLTYEHTSNADLCSANHGLTNVGIKLGWKF
jgi:lipid A 3-O-deacylase